nr:hypothetical protein B0A51_09073 [Rachicladosporium sp. CCFEE 5018]
MAAEMDAPTNGFTSVNNAIAHPPSPPSTIGSAGTKRKRDAKTPAPKFYAVRTGKAPGIYHTWTDCLDQVRGFPKAVFKSFTSLTEAESFLHNQQSAGGEGKVSKYYGVRSGRTPGVYTSWSDVLEQITGWKAPKHKAFKTKGEAEQWVAEGTNMSYPMSDIALESVESLEGPSAKKPKTTIRLKPYSGVKTEISPTPLDPSAYSPGSAPLPISTEDGFDPNITLDSITNGVRYKTATERALLKPQAVRPARDSWIKIYTDGSALANGQAHAIGGIGIYFGPGDKRNEGSALTGSRQTNQRAELSAIFRALELAPQDRRIIIASDSNYAINCVTIWFQKWRSNGYINAQGRAVENKDLIIKIVDVLEQRFRTNRHRTDAEEDELAEGGHWERGPAAVKFEWIKGHAGSEGNVEADRLAVAAAREARDARDAAVVVPGGTVETADVMQEVNGTA